MSTFLIGLEGDFNWSSLRSNVNAAYTAFPSANPLFTISPATETLSTRLDWFSTIRGRGGFTFDRWLVFATGGLAIGHFRSSTSVVYGTSGTSPVFSGASHAGENTTTRLGYAIGGGVEYAFTNNWSLKAEYLYMNFGSWSYASALAAPAAAATAGYAWTTNVSAREHVARVGINYKFDWGAARWSLATDQRAPDNALKGPAGVRAFDLCAMSPWSQAAGRRRSAVPARVHSLAVAGGSLYFSREVA